MDDLAAMKCEACRVGAPQLTVAQIADCMSAVPNWTLGEADGVKRIARTFKFKDFALALAFTDKVGALAEEEGHHPSILTEWGKVTVTLWTHKIRGLHLNDFIMAARIDRLYAP